MDLVDAGQRRVAYCTNLPAGDYRFRVVAYDMNDPRNAAPKHLSVLLSFDPGGLYVEIVDDGCVSTPLLSYRRTGAITA